MTISMKTRLTCDEPDCTNSFEIEMQEGGRGMRKMVKEAQDVGWSWKLVPLNDRTYFRKQTYMCPTHASEWKRLPKKVKYPKRRSRRK